MSFISFNKKKAKNKFDDYFSLSYIKGEDETFHGYAQPTGFNEMLLFSFFMYLSIDPLNILLLFGVEDENVIFEYLISIKNDRYYLSS